MLSTLKIVISLKNKKFLHIIFTLVLSLSAVGQQKLVFEKLTEENKVSQSITYDLDEDRDGNIWIATEEGIVKYNSIDSKIYNGYNGLPKSMGNRVHSVYVDSENTVWAGTEKGVCRYDPLLDKFVLIGSNPLTGPTLIKQIKEDGRGNLFVAAFNGLWILDSGKSQFLKVATESVQAVASLSNGLAVGTNEGLIIYKDDKQFLITNKVLQDTSITSLLVTNDRLLVGTKSEGLYSFSLKMDHQTRILPELFPDGFPINTIQENSSGSYYVGTDGNGLMLLDHKLDLTGHFRQNEDNASSLSSNGIYDIHIGEDSVVWIATYGGGVNRIDPRKSVFTNIKHSFNNKNSIVSNFTRALEVDTMDRIWFGTKKGISIWNRKTDTWTKLPNLEEIILDLESDGRFMWAATYNSGVYKLDIEDLSIAQSFGKTGETKIPLDKVYAICKDSNGNVWMGGIEGPLTVFNIATGNLGTYPINNIRSIIELGTGKMLIGGRNGVFSVEHQSENVQPIRALAPDAVENGYLTVNALSETDDGTLLVATNGAGLLMYNPKNQKTNSLNIQSGLPSDRVQGIIPLTASEVWVSTAKGLAQLNLVEKDTLITVYDKKDGLSSTEFNYGSYKKTGAKELAFGGLDGVTIFNPNEIELDSEPPEIVFESLSLFNKKLQPGEGPLKAHLNTVDSLGFEHNQNSMAFDFVGISHLETGKVRYSWFLEGLEEDWTAPSPEHLANYTNLDPGNYIFNVRASNGKGTWSSVRSLPITISSPWWATTTAYTIYGLLGLLVIFGIIYATRFVVNKRRAEEQIDFFNNITHEIRTPMTILLSSLQEESQERTVTKGTEKIKTTIKRLSALFEQMLNFQKVTSRHESLKDISEIVIEEYLGRVWDNFKPLLEERHLTLETVIDRNEPKFFYNREDLNKILYNLISNAIKYSKHGGNIQVVISPSNEEELKIEVKDDGIGIPKDQQKNILKRFYRARNVANSQEPGVGLGLMIVKNLVEREQGSITFESEEDAGTSFFVSLKDKRAFYKDTSVDGRTLPENPVSLDHSIQAQEFSDAKILIVEDNNELRNTLSNILGVYFQVFEAENGEKGLEVASQNFPDIILTDLIMPEMDGLEMAKKLKEDINLNHIPVFMMTVLQSQTQKLESFEGGISEYIEKPIDFDLLVAKIVSLLGLQSRMRQKYIHQADVDEAQLYRTKNDKEFITKLEKYIIDELDDDSFSVHHLCKEVGMSRTSLYNKLKSLVDLSPQDFIINTKLRFAKKLLMKGEANIKEVAYRSGFSNPKYFSTSFKKFFGVTPSGFSNSLQKKE